MIMKNESLVDKAIRLDKEIKGKKKELDEVKAMIQSEGLEEIENKNLKYLQIYSEEGSCDLSYKQKLDIDNIVILKEIFGEVLDGKVTKKEEIKYEVENKFKSALIALYMGDYKKNDIESILDGLDLDIKEKNLALKKLKGDYLADKKLLESFKLSGEFEEELDAIREAKNYELVNKYIDVENIGKDVLDSLKRAITVNETLALGLSYDKK